jgi:hypothetical protein
MLGILVSYSLSIVTIERDATQKNTKPQNWELTFIFIICGTFTYLRRGH